jgi:formylglycine-generating enzyme required for sulfatase activity
MPRCPICQNRYVLGKDKHCSTCDWDLQAHPFYIAMISEVSQKENTRLAWAVKLWSLFKSQQEELKQARLQLQEADRTKQQFESELERNRTEQSRLAEASRQQEDRLAQLQEQLNQSNLILVQLRSEIDRVKNERADRQVISLYPEVQKYHSLLTNIQVAESQQHGPELRNLVPVKLEGFNFQVKTVDSQGRSISCVPTKAQFFNEDLGNDVFLPMVCLEEGTFLMGSPENEASREIHESPQHSVTVKSFCLSRFPITQAQWQAIAHLPQINRPLNPDPSNFKGTDLPVEQVSWHDAVEFCARLAQLTGRDYRLPSEAQWEYACRAGETTPFHFGETLTSDLANYDGSYTYSSEAEGQYRQRTTPIGSFAIANAFGLCDLHGNVWEWCADSWHENYRDAPRDGSIWQTEIFDSRRVLRGGSWYCLPSLCRSAQRHWDRADHGGSGTSFRVVCSVPDSSNN